MYSVYDDRCLTCRIAPFGHLRITMYLPFPAAFRSLSRPSSAPSAKAFALRPSSLDLLRVLIPLFSRIILLDLVIFGNCSFFTQISLFQNFTFVFLYLFYRVLFSFQGSPRSSHIHLCMSWWAQMGSNHRPRAYQARALAY